jgi:hypothetical protein
MKMIENELGNHSFFQGLPGIEGCALLLPA